MHVYFRVEVTEFPSQSFQNRRSFLSQIFVSLATASRWHTEQLYVVIMMVVKIFREQYDKLKQTNMRFLKRNTGEVAVQLDELVEKYKNKLGNKSYGEIQNKLGNKSWWNCSCICKPDFCSVARRPSAGEEGGEGCSVSFAHFFGSWAKIFLWAIGGPMKSNPWNRGGCGVNQWWEKGSSVYGTTS